MKRVVKVGGIGAKNLGRQGRKPWICRGRVWGRGVEAEAKVDLTHPRHSRPMGLDRGEVTIRTLVSTWVKKGGVQRVLHLRINIKDQTHV